MDKNFGFVHKCPGQTLILMQPTYVTYILILYRTLGNVHFIDIARTVHLIGVQRHCNSDERSSLQKCRRSPKNQYHKLTMHKEIGRYSYRYVYN